MIRLSAYPLILTLCLLASNLSGQIDEYEDRSTWRGAVDNICYTEDLNRFTEDMEFRTMPLQLNGFTIVQDGTDPPFLITNLVDVPPIEDINAPSIDSTLLNIFVDGDDATRTDVVIRFDDPVCGFFADYAGQSTAELLMEVYSSGGTMIDSFTHDMSVDSRGIISTDPNMPITMITMRGANPNGSSFGEAFSMDNIEIACDCTPSEPIPTMGEWALIVLGLSMMILGVVAVGRRVSVV